MLLAATLSSVNQKNFLKVIRAPRSPFLLVNIFMSVTKFYSPKTILQVSNQDNDISWINNFSLGQIDSFNITEKPFYRIARRDNLGGVNSSTQLWCTNFQIPLLENITGIELKLVTQRLARIQDYVIQLTYDNELIGKNLYNDLAEDLQIYGGSNNVWESNISPQQLSGQSFGIVIELGPNKKTPHKDQGYIDFVGIRVYHGD